MGRHSTGSTKIKAELKAKMKKLNSKSSKALRKAAEDGARKTEAQELKQEIGKLKLILSKLSAEEAAKCVREDRGRRLSTSSTPQQHSEQPN